MNTSEREQKPDNTKNRVGENFLYSALMRVIVGIVTVFLAGLIAKWISEPILSSIGLGEHVAKAIRHILSLVAILSAYYWLFTFYEKRKVTELAKQYFLDSTHKCNKGQSKRVSWCRISFPDCQVKGALMYTQLTQEQRYQIHVLLKMEHSRTEIAAALGIHKSTISRELKRNRGKRGYRPKQAHQLALQRRTKARKRITADIWALVEEKLRQDWSPEQISGRFKEEGIAISHEHIYQYIYADKRVGGDLWKHLRCQKKRRKRVGDYDRRGKIPNRKSIEERPEVVEQRARLGDWEVDLMVGKDHQGVLVTLTERKSRFTLLRKVATKQAKLVGQAIVELLQWVSALESITADNGKEFAAHQQISQTLSVDFYFAHPYSSWERGTNENTNGLIRQYLPKSCSLKNVSFQDETMIMDRLNLRPRKRLDFRTPFEVFFGHQPVALAT